MNVRIHPAWLEALHDEFQKPYFDSLAERVRSEYALPGQHIYPPAARIFAAFDACPFDKTKVVIIGQDPYHGPGQADGLAFSVQPGIKMPPSLVNILREVHDDTGAPLPPDGSLQRWADQGVLLLNTSLTVREHQAASHADIGWRQFTEAVIRKLATEREGLVFLLWGSHAARIGANIDRQRHLVLTAPHPSPLSAYRGFFGCRHFSQANRYLVQQGLTPIEW